MTERQNIELVKRLIREVPGLSLIPILPCEHEWKKRGFDLNSQRQQCAICKIYKPK